MVSNFQIGVVSVLAMTLFVLLIYPAIVPVNAPPHMKTYKDLFLAFAVVALLGLFRLTALINAAWIRICETDEAPPDKGCALFCTFRC